MNGSYPRKISDFVEITTHIHYHTFSFTSISFLFYFSYYFFFSFFIKSVIISIILSFFFYLFPYLFFFYPCNRIRVRKDLYRKEELQSRYLKTLMTMTSKFMNLSFILIYETWNIHW